jgi:hypothetical protein
MSDPESKERAGNPTNPDVTQVSTDGPPSPLDDISLPEGGLGYGAGTLDYNPNLNPEGRGALGNNIPKEGDYNESVQALQTYIANELDEEWDGSEYGNTPELPRFGIDGVWRCETQAAFDKLVDSKGIQGTPGPESPCPGSNYKLDDKTLKALKDSEKEKKEKEDEEEAEDVKKKDPTFSDQCFLIENLEKINPKTPKNQISFHETGGGLSRKQVKYKNIHKLETKDPATIMNRLKITKGSGEFLNIRHFQLSQLTPMVRLYKEYYESPESPPKEVEFKFSSFVDPVDDLQSMLNSELQRGVGVGIESFDFNFVGVQPATVKKDIEAKLVIYAQNFNELFKVRQGEDQHGKPIDGGYRIIDLVLLEPKYRNILEKGKNTKTRVFNPQFYEIKVRAGWAATGGGGLLSDELSSAIKDNQVEMFLVLTKHKFQFQDDGSVRLILDFRARLESVLLDRRSDVLFNPEVIRKRDERENKIREITASRSALSEQKKDTCDDINENIKKLKQSYEESIEEERQIAYGSLLKTLLLESCVYTAVVTKVPDVFETGQDLGLSVFVENYGCDDETSLPKNLLLQPGVRRVNFFYLGDLIALAVNNVLENMGRQSTSAEKINYGNVKFILGPAPLDTRRTSEENANGLTDLNIADIPISVELFTDFMREKVIKGRKNSYPLLVFIRDTIKDLVFEALGPQCGSGDDQLRLQLATAQISADSGAGGVDQVATKIGKKPALQLDEYATNLVVPLDSESAGLFGRKNLGKKNNAAKTKFVFDSFNKKPLSESFEYFVVYAYGLEPRRLAFEKGDGGHSNRYERDLSNGIFHVSTGLDRGLTKSMQFGLSNQKYLREARYEQSDFKPELQLSDVYNASIRMYGNNLFFPGTQVFVNPRGLGSDALGDPGHAGSNANVMGLGGYHLVTKVKHSINSSGYTTNMDALFTSSGDGKGSVMDNNTRVGDKVIIECADLTAEIDNALAEYTSEGDG